MKAGFTVLLLLLLIDLPPMLGRKFRREKCIYKVHAQSSAPVDLPKLCGDNIMKVYIDICKATVWAKRKRRRGKYDHHYAVTLLTSNISLHGVSYRDFM